MRRDWLVAGLFAGAVAVGGWRAGLGQDPPRVLDAAGYALVALAALGLGFRRRRPLVALVVAVVAGSVYLAAGYPFGPVSLTIVWAMFEYARRRPLRVSALALGGAALVQVLAVLPRMARDLDLLAVGLVLWGACWLAVPWSLGALVWMRRQIAERDRAELVRRVVLEERVRVSREVHDVAGHGFAVVAMQAGVALVVLDEEPGQAREALRAIRDTSRAALEELRAVIENIDSPADVEGLVEQVRAGGVAVALEYDGLAGASERQRRIAYEVVREALTNVVKHAPRAGATVSLRIDGDVVTVAVGNPGNTSDHDAGVATGGEQDQATNHDAGVATGGEQGHAANDDAAIATGGDRDQATDHGTAIATGGEQGPATDHDARTIAAIGDPSAAMEYRQAPGHQETRAPEAGERPTGRGIDGMRERVESAGGSFEVRRGEAFAVHARIPR